MAINKKALAAGRSFEEEFAAQIGAKLQPGSGNQWFAKLDVDASNVLWSLKWTEKRTFAITPDLILEADRATSGPAGTGQLPAIAARIGGVGDIAVMRMEHFFDVATGKVSVKVGDQKAERARAQADLPLLERGG